MAVLCIEYCNKYSFDTLCENWSDDVTVVYDRAKLWFHILKKFQQPIFSVLFRLTPAHIPTLQWSSVNSSNLQKFKVRGIFLARDHLC